MKQDHGFFAPPEKVMDQLPEEETQVSRESNGQNVSSRRKRSRAYFSLRRLGIIDRLLHRGSFSHRLWVYYRAIRPTAGLLLNMDNSLEFQPCLVITLI